LHLSPAISAEDLDRLTPGDINYVVWSTAWPSNTPDPCEP